MESDRGEFMRVPWPQEDLFDYRVTQGKAQIKLHSYFYPCQTDQRRGVLFYIHGHGTYAGRFAYFFKLFAEAGFDVFAVDQRGFGKSEGERGCMDSQEAIYKDNWGFIERVLKEYQIDTSSTQVHIMGHSCGGLIAYNMAAERPGFFASALLIVPFFEAAIENFNKYQWALKLISPLMPRLTFADENKPETIAKYDYYFNDPLEYRNSRSRSVRIMFLEQQKALSNAPSFATPLFVVTA